VTESELRSALSSKPHQRQLQIVDRVLPAPAAVAWLGPRNASIAIVGQRGGQFASSLLITGTA